MYESCVISDFDSGVSLIEYEESMIFDQDNLNIKY